jgi:hypothetical protein
MFYISYGISLPSFALINASKLAQIPSRVHKNHFPTLLDSILFFQDGSHQVTRP